MRELTAQQEADLKDNVMMSFRYVVLWLAELGVFVALLIGSKWLLAFLLWLLMAVTSGLAVYYRRLADEVFDE
jgi:hypothetical protein